MEELKGNEMVMEIAQKVSAWLAAQNKAMLGKKNPFSSFYEEMVSLKDTNGGRSYNFIVA